MDTTGLHLLFEYHGCDATVLNDASGVERLLCEAAVAAGATVVASIFHPFRPQGVTGVVVIEESHLSIHTWPEKGYAAVDFYTCGHCRPEKAHAVLSRALRPLRSESLLVRRGNFPTLGHAMRIESLDEIPSGGSSATDGDEVAAEDPFKRRRTYKGRRSSDCPLFG